MTLRVEGDQQSNREHCQRDDAGGEGQPLTTEGELARHEAVARKERSEARESRRSRVGGQGEDERGRDLK